MAAPTHRPLDAPLSAWPTLQPPPYPQPRQYTSCYCEENTFLLVQHLARFASQHNRTFYPQRRNETTVTVAKDWQGNRSNSSNDSKDDGTAGTSPSSARARHALVPIWDVRAIFISNSSKTVLLLEQCASRAPPGQRSPVVWDYHVFAALTCTFVPLDDTAADVPRGEGSSRSELFETRSWIYDPDSRLSYPPSPQTGQPDRSESPQPVPLEHYLCETFGSADAVAARVPPRLRCRARIVDADDLLAHFASDRSHMVLPSPAGSKGSVQWSSPPPAWPLIVGSKAKQTNVTNNLMERYVCTDSSEDGIYGRVLTDLDFLSAAWTKPCRRPGQTVDGLEVAETLAERPSPPGKQPWREQMRRTLLLSPSIAARQRPFSAADLPVKRLSPPPVHPSRWSMAPVSPPTGSISLPASRSATPASPPSGQRRVTPPLSSSTTKTPTKPPLEKSASFPVTLERPRRGGRVSSPLFPAYLALSSQSRAELPPQSPTVSLPLPYRDPVGSALTPTARLSVSAAHHGL
ncbi:hypothetical protein ACQY0O_005402 [Thecaphora frezii]